MEVPIKTCCPPEMERLEEETVKLPSVVVPMPPLETASRPVTSAEPRLMAPLNRAPAAVLLTGRALDREIKVVEPEILTVPATPKVATGELLPIPTFPELVTLNRETLEEEETSNGSTVPLPLTAKEVEGEVELMPTLPFKIAA